MKKFFSLILFSLLLAGCNSAPSWQASIETAPIYKKDSASTFELKVTDQDKPVTGVTITALVEMAKMDHGSIEVKLNEQENGIYQGNVELPMAGEWQAIVTMTADDQTMEQTVQFSVKEAEGIASVNGNVIQEDDLQFYQFINNLQIAMYEEVDKQRYEGDALAEALKYWEQQRKAAEDQNTLLTQIIRLQAAALLGKEKGYHATEQEITTALNQVKDQYGKSPIALEMIESYGNDKFWTKQASQYELIVLTQKVQSDIIDIVKQENPEAAQNEIHVLAQKKYEELLVSQMGTLDIKVF